MRRVLLLTWAHSQSGNHQLMSWEALPWPRGPMELPHHYCSVPGCTEDSVGIVGAGDLQRNRWKNGLGSGLAVCWESTAAEATLLPVHGSTVTTDVADKKGSVLRVERSPAQLCCPEPLTP